METLTAFILLLIGMYMAISSKDKYKEQKAINTTKNETGVNITQFDKSRYYFYVYIFWCSVYVVVIQTQHILINAIKLLGV